MLDSLIRENRSKSRSRSVPKPMTKALMPESDTLERVPAKELTGIHMITRSGRNVASHDEDEPSTSTSGKDGANPKVSSHVFLLLTCPQRLVTRLVLDCSHGYCFFTVRISNHERRP